MHSENRSDVIVAGSGPSGIAAALTSARGGAKTLLIEWQGCVGGISTSGLMSHFTGSVDSRLYDEMLTRAAGKNYFSDDKTPVIDPEMLKITYYEMLSEAGVDIILYSFISDVLTNGNKVEGVVTTGKSGTSVYTAKTVIDCTGDGDVAYLTGAEYIKAVRKTAACSLPRSCSRSPEWIPSARFSPPALRTRLKPRKASFRL